MIAPPCPSRDAFLVPFLVLISSLALSRVLLAATSPAGIPSELGVKPRTGAEPTSSAVEASTVAAPAASAYPATPIEPSRCRTGWPHWDAYGARFVARDGRVIDRTDGDRSTSEGQAYGMFLALVFGDRDRFEGMRRWTENNLAGGELGANLPAWLWGRRGDGSWGVRDANPASDADLWMAYALLEAGRLWNEPRYLAQGRTLLATIVEREIVEVPKEGPVLLPGPHGFRREDGSVRLNPSYLPLPLLRRFRSLKLPGPWDALASHAVRLVTRTTPHGAVPDWVILRNGRYEQDTERAPAGSYDAIRVYLWAGLLPRAEPLRAELMRVLKRPLDHFQRHGVVPERMDPRKGDDASGSGPPGFLAALIPLATERDPALARRLDAALQATRADGLYGTPATYYDQNLVLFAKAFTAGHYRFEANGALHPRWSETCGSR